MHQTMIKKDGFQTGGILSGLLVVPESDLHKVKISGVGKIRDFQMDPGRGAIVRYQNKPGDRERFDGAGVATVIPDLDAGRQVVLAFSGRHNAFVNQGLQRVLDSAYGDLTAVRITHIGLSADNTAVTATTTSLDPGAAGTSIKVTANTSRTNQTVHADQTWTQADVTWAMHKIGLLTAVTATNVVNIIGGAGGSAPYNEPFTIDLTSIASWSLTMGIDVTATAS